MQVSYLFEHVASRACWDTSWGICFIDRTPSIEVSIQKRICVWNSYLLYEHINGCNNYICTDLLDFVSYKQQKFQHDYSVIIPFPSSYDFSKSCFLLNNPCHSIPCVCLAPSSKSHVDWIFSYMFTHYSHTSIHFYRQGDFTWKEYAHGNFKSCQLHQKQALTFEIYISRQN